MENLLFICYPKCGTCKKAEVFLKENNVNYTFRDIKTDSPTLEELTLWHSKSGLDIKKFFNTSGLLYKSMHLKEKLPTMTLDEKLELLSTDGMLVKRPILIGNDFVVTGFKAADWENLIG